MKDINCKGFTILEILVASTILAMVCGIGLSMTVTGMNAAKDVANRSEIQERAMYAVNRIAKELMKASWKTVTPTSSAPNSSNYITYQKVVSYNFDTDEYTLSAVNEFEFKTISGQNYIENNDVIFISRVAQYAQGETSASGDENGNGLINEAGLSFEKKGEQRIVIRLTIEKTVNNKLVQESAETTVYIRQP